MGNCALAHVVAAGKFSKRRAFGASSPRFGLLRFSKFRGSAYVLPALLRTAPAFGSAGADKIALNIGQPPSTASIKRPVLVPVSAHGSA